MHFVREIWLRHVKCAAAREGIYFISHCDEGAIFHDFRKKIISHSALPNISLKSQTPRFRGFLFFRDENFLFWHSFFDFNQQLRRVSVSGAKSPLTATFLPLSLLYGWNLPKLRTCEHTCVINTTSLFRESLVQCPKTCLHVRGSQKKALAIASAFFNEINPLRDLWNALRAWNTLRVWNALRRVRGFISFHIATIGSNISQFLQENYFTYANTEYFAWKYRKFVI